MLCNPDRRPAPEAVSRDGLCHHPDPGNAARIRKSCTRRQQAPADRPCRWRLQDRPPTLDKVMKPFYRQVVNALPSAVLAVFALVLTGCASTKDNFPPAPVSATTHDYTYIIGAGDGLNIIVWRNPELSMSVPVRPDGKVAAPPHPPPGSAHCTGRQNWLPTP